MREPVVIVHPDDMNMADAKRLAADYNTTVQPNKWVPRGQMLLVDATDSRIAAKS